MQRIPLFIQTALLILTLSSCGHVAILDKETCVDEGSLGAHCAHQYSTTTRNILQPDWDNTRFGWFCMNPDDTVETKKEAEELCSIKGVTCDYQAQQKIQSVIHSSFVLARKLRAHAKSAQASITD
jgi:hypothetical protein